MIPDAVKAYARRMGSREVPADDLVQDAALSIVRAGGARLSGAARITIGYNAIRDELRKLRTRRERGPRVLPDVWGTSPAPGPLALTLAQDARDAVERTVGVRGRQVLASLLAGHSQSDTARRMELSPATVHRAVGTLRTEAARLGLR